MYTEQNSVCKAPDDMLPDNRIGQQIDARLMPKIITASATNTNGYSNLINQGLRLYA